MDEMMSWRGLSETEIAALLEEGSDEVGSWCKHEIDALPGAHSMMNPLTGLTNRLQAIFSISTDSRAWMQQPNEYLNGQRPVDALQSGGVEHVFNALAFVRIGVGR